MSLVGKGGIRRARQGYIYLNLMAEGLQQYDVLMLGKQGLSLIVIHRY